MTMKKLIPWIFTMLLVGVVALPADAQKKKQSAKPAQQESQQQQAPVAQPAPVPQMQPLGKTTGFKDLLLQYQGMVTNLGTLTKVGPDYLLLDDEGSTMLIPLQSVQSVRVVKPKEAEESTKIDIKLVSKD
jgi:hypothetical protein